MKTILLLSALFASASLYAQDEAPVPPPCSAAESSECIQSQLTALKKEVDQLKERLNRVPGEREAEIRNALFLIELPQSHQFDALVRTTVGWWRSGTTKGGTHHCRKIEPKEHYETVLLKSTINIGRRKGECMPRSSNECDSKGERCDEIVVGGCYVREDLVARMKRNGQSSERIVSTYCPGATAAFDAAVERVRNPNK